MSKPVKVMYVGPTFDGIAARNTVYEDLPEPLKEVIKKRPYISGLCVPIPDLSKALQQIDRKQGGKYNLYTRAESEKSAIMKGD